jgi:KaiC/GvpD/RAD55 family RecA-like ATPase
MPASMIRATRLTTGISGLDEHLGGGFVPGALAVIVGATGIGKTQLGLHFAHAGGTGESRPGVILDASARIDPQCHATYAARLFGWNLREHGRERFSPETCFDSQRSVGDYLHAFENGGRAVIASQAVFDVWHDWQAELAAKLGAVIDFFYSNFVRGTRRVVLDGIEPARAANESIQLQLVEYVYHQVLRKDAEWVARDLFRQAYRAHAETIKRHAYDFSEIGALLLLTSHETMLDELIARPLVDGDLLAAANTLIYLGKIREGNKLSRGLFIAKHRGSRCADSIVRYEIDDRGIRLA